MKSEREFADLFDRFVHDESGSPAIEYSLLGALIGIACVAVFVGFGDSLANLFGSGSTGVSPELENATGILAGD